MHMICCKLVKAVFFNKLEKLGYNFNPGGYFKRMTETEE
jgi:hypothetical protein